MVKKLKCPGRIFHSKIELHPVVVFKFKTEFTVFDETVPSVFIETIQPDTLKAMTVKPFAGWLIDAQRTACND